MSFSGRTANVHPIKHPKAAPGQGAVGRSSAPGSQAILLCASLLAGAAMPAFAKPDSVPDWVRAAAAQPLPPYSPETRAVNLLEDITYTVAPDGRAVEHVRRVIKILRPQGRDEAIVHVNFDDDTKILSMHAWSIGPDGHEYAMKDKDFTDVGINDNDVAFQDDKFRVARAPGADPGGVVAYEYEQRTRPMLTEKTWFFQDDIPHVSEIFTLELPAGYTYGTQWSRHAPMEAVDLEKQRWRWEMKNVPAIDLERVPLSPAPMSLAARMTVHYAGSGNSLATDGTWKSIGEWYGRLYQERVLTTPEITAKAKELTAQKTDFYDKTEAIAEFVQKQIRYVAVEVGIGGYQPHPAGDVFRNRYGDCKDKATLLASMLFAVGIHAAPVMVHSERGVVDPSAPSIVGNHMIAAIELPAGYTSPHLHSIVTAKSGRRYLIFDPTWAARAPYGELEHDLQGGYGLLLEGSDSQVIQLPLLDPALNTIHRTATFQLQPDGVLKGTVTEKRFGDLSSYRRELYSSHDAKEQRDFLDHLLEHDFTSFTTSDVKADNVSALNQDFTLSYALNAERYAKSMGPLLMVRPRVLGRLDLYIDHKRRSVPINLEETMQVNDEYSIELPDGYVVDELPDPVKIDLGFAAYQSAVDVKANMLHYARTYTVREVTVPADRYADVQKLAGVIAADEDSSAVLKKK